MSKNLNKKTIKAGQYQFGRVCYMIIISRKEKEEAHSDKLKIEIPIKSMFLATFGFYL